MEEREGLIRHLLMLGSGIMVLALLWSGLLGERGLHQHGRLRSEIASVDEELANARSGNLRLKARFRALRHSEAYVEWTARQELGWTGEDEVILTLPR